jgi:hypothetical protein
MSGFVIHKAPSGPVVIPCAALNAGIGYSVIAPDVVIRTTRDELAAPVFSINQSALSGPDVMLDTSKLDVRSGN